MDPFNFASLIYSYLASRAAFKAYFNSSFDHQARLRRSYGKVTSVVVTTISPDTAIRYARLEQDVLRGSAQNVLTFRQSVTDDCNITAVIVSVHLFILVKEEC